MAFFENAWKSVHKKSLSEGYYSQLGQDKWVLETLKRKRNGYFVDIGASDGKYMSNTYILEHKYQWKGLCIEPSPGAFEKLRRQRKTKCICCCLDTWSREVYFQHNGPRSKIINQISWPTEYRYTKIKTKSLLRVLKEAKAPFIIDYLSIDSEGSEDRILLKFPFGLYKFRTMTIERPSDRLRKRLKTYGYKLVKSLPQGHETFWVNTQLVPK